MWTGTRQARGRAGRRRRSRCDAERGSATIWVVTAMAVLMLAGGTGMVRAVAVAARHRAAAAADLGALAAAGRMVVDPGRACARAKVIAAANGAQMTDCVLAGVEVTVTVRSRLPIPVAGLAATARARAGPVAVE